MTQQTVSSAFERELKTILDRERQRVASVIISGIAIQSIEQYRERVGEMNALNLVYDLCAEAAENVNKR